MLRLLHQADIPSYILLVPVSTCEPPDNRAISLTLKRTKKLGLNTAIVPVSPGQAAEKCTDSLADKAHTGGV